MRRISLWRKKHPQEINDFIYEDLGPYGTSEFSDRVLEGTMTEEDKPGFSMIEAKELFMVITRQDPQLPQEKWTSETLERLKEKLNKTPTQQRDDGETEQTGNDRDISLRIMPWNFHRIFSKWKESTTSSPSGRHIGHYRAILGNKDLL